MLGGHADPDPERPSSSEESRARHPHCAVRGRDFSVPLLVCVCMYSLTHSQVFLQVFLVPNSMCLKLGDKSEVVACQWYRDLAVTLLLLSWTVQSHSTVLQLDLKGWFLACFLVHFPFFVQARCPAPSLAFQPALSMPLLGWSGAEGCAADSS